MHIAADGGRICRPLIVCRNGKPRLQDQHVQKVGSADLACTPMVLMPDIPSLCRWAHQQTASDVAYHFNMCQLQMVADKSIPTGMPCVCVDTMSSPVTASLVQLICVTIYETAQLCVFEPGQLKYPAGPCHELAAHVPLGSQPGLGAPHTADTSICIRNCTAGSWFHLLPATSKHGHNSHRMHLTLSHSHATPRPAAPKSREWGFMHLPQAGAAQTSSRHWACAAEERGVGLPAPAPGRPGGVPGRE